jgi:hypothetical protein
MLVMSVAVSLQDHHSGHNFLPGRLIDHAIMSKKKEPGCFARSARVMGSRFGRPSVTVSHLWKRFALMEFVEIESRSAD